MIAPLIPLIDLDICKAIFAADIYTYTCGLTFPSAGLARLEARYVALVEGAAAAMQAGHLAHHDPGHALVAGFGFVSRDNVLEKAECNCLVEPG